MKNRTKTLASQVQQTLLALDSPTIFAILDYALQESTNLCDDVELEDVFRFHLGWLLEDDEGHRYTEWPHDINRDCDWIAPTPSVIKQYLTTLDAQAFYHDILPIFFRWPPLQSDPPSSYSDGYRWMQVLATWLSQPHLESFKERQRSHIDLSPRMTTTEIAQGLPIPLGDCGNAWQLSAMGGPLDIIDHRPYTPEGRTPVGFCTDAPVLILYPERGSVDWPPLLSPTPLRPGSLVSGASIWLIYLTLPDYEWMQKRAALSLSDIAVLLSRDALGFTQYRNSNLS